MPDRPLSPMEAYGAIQALADTDLPGFLRIAPGDPHQLKRRGARPIEVTWGWGRREVVARWDGTLFAVEAHDRRSGSAEGSGHLPPRERAEYLRRALGWLRGRRTTPFGDLAGAEFPTEREPGCDEGEGRDER